MSFIIKFLLQLPFGVRVAISLFIIITVCKILAKPVLWILAIIPFLLEKLFILIYQIIELPITILHKKLGGGFYNIDNFIASLGKKIDDILVVWYNHWHNKYSFHMGKAFIVYLILLSYIVLPSLFSLEHEWLKMGENLYLSSENVLVQWCEKKLLYEPKQKTMTESNKQAVLEKSEITKSEIELVVSGVSSSLLVRDIPDMENATTLDRLYNGDKVVWTGEFIFAEAENNHVETWAKIITQSGIEGWSRLFYLHPLDYEENLFYVEKK